MNRQPLVSVIVPIYNGEKYVEKCLTVLTNQSYTNLEIIVVNDGSTDDSAKVARKFPVKLIEHAQNRGLSEARNTGIDNASGEYIHFMDNDDLINEDFYKNLVTASQLYQADMTACGMIHQKAKYKTQLFASTLVFEDLHSKLKATYVGKWGYVVRYLFRKDFLLQHNLRFEKGKVVEDLPFSFQSVYFANRLVVVPNTKYLYVFNTSSIMNSKTKEAKLKRRSGRVYAKKFVLNFAKKNGGFKIPGVNQGFLTYLIRKIYFTIWYSFKKVDL